jgi:hypothetical protein
MNLESAGRIDSLESIPGLLSNSQISGSVCSGAYVYFSFHQNGGSFTDAKEARTFLWLYLLYLSLCLHFLTINKPYLPCYLLASLTMITHQLLLWLTDCLLLWLAAPCWTCVWLANAGAWADSSTSEKPTVIDGPQFGNTLHWGGDGGGGGGGGGGVIGEGKTDPPTVGSGYHPCPIRQWRRQQRHR